MSLYALHVPSGATGAYHDATSPSFTSFLAQIPLFLSFELIVTRTSGTATATLHVEIDWKDKSGTSLTPFTSDIVIDATSQSLKKFQVTPPANAYSGTCYLKITPAASPMIHDVQIQNLRLGKTELAATLGADWSGNILNRPANLGSLVGSEVITNSSIGITSGVIAGIGTGNNTPVGNALVSIGSNGALAGGGGGQVTLPGIGFSGDTNATYGATWGTNVKAQPSIPDLQDEFNYPDVATCQLKWSLNVPANASMVNTTDTGGKALQIGDNAGNDAVNGIMLQGLPYITTETYELVWDVEIVAAGPSAVLYLGVQALDAAGNNLGSSYNYVAASALNESTHLGRQTFRGYMKGTGPVAAGATGSTPDAPVVLPDGSRFAFGQGGTVTIKPIFLANYTGQPGQIIIHSVTLRRMRDWSTNLAGRPGELTDGRVANGLSAVNGYVDFSRPHIGKNLDNIGDGPTYGRPLITRLNGGKPLIDFSEPIHLNKSLANVDAAASAKLTGIAAGATVGATWGGNLTGTPGNLSALTGSETIRNNLISLNGVGQLTYDGTNTVSTSKLDNGLISIGSNGALTGGGGGQVTIGGLTPNGLDNIADGPTYAKIPLVNTFGSGTSRTAKIDFTLGHVGKGALATKDVVTPSLTTVPTGGNLNPDPKYSDTAGWTLTGNAAYGTFSFALPTDSANASTALTAMNASKGVRFLGDGATTGASTAYSGAFWNQFIPVIPGQVYRLGGKRYVTTPSASSTITTYVQCKVLLTDGTYVYPTVTLADSTVAGLSAVSGQVTMPANAVSAQLQCFVAAPAGTVRSYDIYFGELTLVQCSDWANTITSRPTNLAALSGTEGVNNALVSIGSNGALTGGGGGQVTIGGLGYTGDLNATLGATWGTNLSGRPANLSGLAGTEPLKNALIALNGLGQLTYDGTNTVSTSKLDNGLISIGTNGAMIGGGGGQVTYAGIGGKGLGLRDTLGWGDAAFTGRPANLATLTGTEGIKNSLVPATDANRIRFSRMEGGTTGYAVYDNSAGTSAIDQNINAGKRYVHVSGNFTANGQAGSVGTQGVGAPTSPYAVPVTAGERLFVGAQVSSGMPNPGCTTILRVYFMDATGASTGSFDIFNGNGSDSMWTRRAGFCTVPANSVFCSIVYYALNNSLGITGAWNLYLAEPMICGATADQVTFPSFNAPLSGEFGATLGASWSGNVTARPANLAALAGSEGINNGLISIGANGAMSGGGGGQVTIHGITPNGLDDVADGTAFARVSAAELSGGVPKVTIKGSGKTVGDMRNIPVVGAAGGRYRFTGAISYSASPTVATITVGAGNLVMGSVTIPYNSMSLTINSSANAPISRTLYVDTNVTVAGAHTLKGVDPSDPAAIADVYGSDTVAIVGSISFTMPNSTTSSGGGTAWSGVGPAPSGGSIP